MLAATALGAIVERTLLAATPDAWRGLRPLPGRPATDAAHALADAATLIALSAWTWLLLSTGIATVVALRGPGSRRWHRAARQVVPDTVHGLAAWILGATLVAFTAAPAAAVRDAGAGAAAAGGVRVQTSSPASSLRGLPLPDRPTGRPPPTTSSQACQDPQPPPRRLVRAGDTLWAIAAERLGDHATPGRIAAAWPGWYAANRDRIGPDPDLILPGTMLRVPRAGPSQPDERPRRDDC